MSSRIGQTSLLLAISFTFCGSITVQSVAATEKLDPKSLQVERIEENRIFFRTTEGKTLNEPLKTNIFDLTHLGQIVPEADGGVPYFIFAGSPCRDCVQDRSIYMLRPTGGKPSTFVYPGRIVDQKTGLTLVDSRAFYGKCLPNRGDVFVVFQKENIPRKRRGVSHQQSVFIAQPSESADRLEERLLDKNLPRLEFTLKRVKSKSCFEISGRNRTTRPISALSPSADQVDADDEVEEDGQKPAADDGSPAASPGAPAGT